MMLVFRGASLSMLLLAFSLLGSSACKKGSSNGSPVAPDPGLPPATSITLCGTTTQGFNEPCSPPPANTIYLVYFTQNPPLPCPCFTFTLLNLTQSDLGTVQQQGSYGITGLRAGTYQVSGQLLVENLNFKLTTNTTYSAIGVVPGSVNSLSGPAISNSNPCSVQYTTPKNLLPTTFSFEFKVASTADGGTCTAAS